MTAIHLLTVYAPFGRFGRNMPKFFKPNILRGNPDDGIKPLPIGITPIDGESLLSMISRAAHDNVYENMGHFLKFAEVEVFRPSYIQFTQMHRASAIAKLLSITERTVGRTCRPSL